VFASILNASPPDQPGTTTGVIINVGTDPKDPWRTVRLRNIDISGSGSGNTGISILAAAAVILEDLEVTGNVKNGINDARTEAMGSALTIKNTIVASNSGVGIAAGAQSNSIVLDNVQSIRNATGLSLAKTNTATINRSVFSTNATGVSVDSGGQMTLDGSMVSFNATGISASGGAVGFANSDVAFNSTALSGNTTTFGNNRIFGNGAVGTPPSPAGAAAPALGQQ
jgi:hypothetical protein